MTFGLLEIVQLIALYHAGLMGIVILLHPRLRGLGLLCIGFALHMGFNLGITTNLISYSIDISDSFYLIYGPFFFLFVRDLCFENQQTKWLDSLHILPAVLIAFLRPDPPIPEFLGYLSLGIYIGMALMALREHRRLNAEIRSDSDLSSLYWLELTLTCFAGLAIIDICRDIFSANLQPIQDTIILSTLIMSVPILFSLMATRSLNHQKQKGGFPASLDKLDFEDHSSRSKEPYPNSAFTNLDQMVREEELWREVSFSLADLARHSGLPVRDLSFSIHTGAGQSFSSYINSIRIEAAERLMAETGNTAQSLNDLHSEIGFASRSTFSRVYKEQKGITPAKAFSRLVPSNP